MKTSHYAFSVYDFFLSFLLLLLSDHLRLLLLPLLPLFFFFFFFFFPIIYFFFFFFFFFFFPIIYDSFFFLFFFFYPIIYVSFSFFSFFFFTFRSDLLATLTGSSHSRRTVLPSVSLLLYLQNRVHHKHVVSCLSLGPLWRQQCAEGHFKRWPRGPSSQ